MPEKMEAKKKILIVDDDQFLREMVTGAFTEAGFEVMSASDGEEAWEKISGGYRPDVVLTGITMPRMTGFELIEKIRADSELTKIPVAIFSHRGREEDRERARQMDVGDFILRASVPLTEIIRRMQILAGESGALRISLKRYYDDAERLLKLLDIQEGTQFAEFKDETLFLELTPQKDKGIFMVKIKKKEGTILGG